MKLLLVLLFSVASYAQISRDGTCTASANNCTFSATATGDLKIIFATRNASGTAPTLPVGWTSIATVAQSTNAAIRIGCNVSTGSGDTGSGTWTNASRIVGISFAGTPVVSLVLCNTTGVGVTANNSAASSTTINFPALSGMAGAGNSWVAGFAFSNGALVGAPSGMSQVVSAGAGPAAAGNDTEAMTASWSSQNVTAASGNWISFVAEILGTGTPSTHVRHSVRSSKLLAPSRAFYAALRYEIKLQ